MAPGLPRGPRKPCEHRDLENELWDGGQPALVPPTRGPEPQPPILLVLAEVFPLLEVLAQLLLFLWLDLALENFTIICKL